MRGEGKEGVQWLLSGGGAECERVNPTELIH